MGRRRPGGAGVGVGGRTRGASEPGDIAQRQSWSNGLKCTWHFCESHRTAQGGGPPLLFHLLASSLAIGL